MDLQKAGLWKRTAAWMFDSILLGILAVAFGVLLSWALGYDGYSQTMDEAYEMYETQYGVVFDISRESYEAMTEGERERYNAAYDALIADENAMHAYSMMLNLTLVILTLAILLATAVIEWLIPLKLGSGRTLGKKIFGLALMRTDSVQMNKAHWLSVALDGSVEDEKLKFLVDMSYELTKK